MVRAVIIIAIIAAAATAFAADTKPPPPPPTPVSAATQALLDRIAKGDKPALDELNAIAPKIVPELRTFLAREHKTAVDDRRTLLESFGADVPDAKGRFAPPRRKSAKEEKKDDELDWLVELGKLDLAMAGVPELLTDIAAIRALAASKDIGAAQVMFDVAFSDDTMIYRDEVGRYLRRMEPFSIPALMKESQSRKFDRKRYSNYQLERLDRQEPYKALAATTGDEALTLAILETWRVTRHREAVHAVWSKVNADSPRVRAKAREAWRAYVEGPPPPPAPKKKLQMPGGRLTKKEKPLWLTYRELADNELRKAANELLHEDYKIAEQGIGDDDPKVRIEPIDQVEVTKRLFAYFDGERAKHDAAQWQAAKAKSDKGDLAGAATLLDQLVAQTPDRAERTQMAEIYARYGKELEQASKWSEAAAAYSKSYGLDHKQSSLAAHHYALGKALESKGKDGGPDYRAAVALDPGYAPARAAAEQVESAHSRPIWMLYAAVGAGLLAMLLFAAAMLRRRAS
jgi:tetratricopeptide (TPR) repeat protein